MPEFDSTVEYRTIPLTGLEGYMVGSDGTVWSCWKKRGLGIGFGTESYRSGEWVQLKPCLCGGRSRQSTRPAMYYYGFDAKGKTVHLHKAIAYAFLGPRPSPRHECRHMDGNPFNNRLENLSWGTSGQNNHDRIRHGTMPSGEKNGNAKLTSEQVAKIRQLRSEGMIYREIAAMFGVHKNTIRYACIGATWDIPQLVTPKSC